MAPQRLRSAHLGRRTAHGTGAAARGSRAHLAALGRRVRGRGCGFGSGSLVGGHLAGAQPRLPGFFGRPRCRRAHPGCGAGAGGDRAHPRPVATWDRGHRRGPALGHRPQGVRREPGRWLPPCPS